MLSTCPTSCPRPILMRLALCLTLLLTGFSLGQTTAFGQVSRPVDNAKKDNTEKKVTYKLRILSAEALHLRMEKVLRRKLETAQDPSGQWLGFNIDQTSGAPVTIWASTTAKQLQISGPNALIDPWLKVITVLDTPVAKDQSVELVSAQPGAQAKVRQVVNVIEKTELTALEGQQPAATQRASQAISLLGPVQIETVEGTDILLLRGNPRDVERVLEVIDEIEQMSEVSEPNIEVVPIKHVQSEALALLVKQIFSESLTSEAYGYGSVGVYPIARPNSLLIIALPATMERAKEILTKLDQPGSQSAQFEIFPLKHAKASDASQIVTNLFEASQSTDDANSLEPKAQVIADTRTNSLIVRASPRDLVEVKALIKQIDDIGSQSVNELRIFKLKTSVAGDLKTVLDSAFSGGDANNPDSNLSRLLRLVTIDAEGKRQIESGVLADTKVTASESANALIVAAPAESMPLLEALITQLDQGPDAAIELKIFPLKNGDATSLVDTLSQLFGTGDNNNNSDESNITRLRIEVDERTNSILAAGTLEDLITVEAILRTLDSTDARQRVNKIYRIKNKSALDVAEALNEWIDAERDVQGTAPGTASPFQQIEREVVVVPELSSNSLIVSATPRYYEKVAQLIHDLDAQDPMVMIQVLIAEIELGDIDEFGIELGLQDSMLFDRSLLGDLETTTNTTITNDAGGGSTTFEQQVIQAATNTPGFDFGNPSNGLGNAGSTQSLATASNVAGQVLSSFGVNRVSSDAGFGGLVLSASSNSISMLLRALQETRRLEVLSRPQIMTMDNQTGSVFVGQIVPFITDSTPNQLGPPTNTVERIQVGLNLEVTPRISPDGLVVMDVFAANNRLRPLSEGVPVGISLNGDPILQPIQDAIEASTTVSATSGQTIVLSGLITKEDSALHRRVPLLADIPLLGSLFRFDSTSTRRRELLIILTPHVVRNRFDSEMLKQVESARMNWCLSDVVDLHGPAGLRSATDQAGVAESETIYPEQVPAEQLMPHEQPTLTPNAPELAPQPLPSLGPIGPSLESQPITAPEGLPLPAQR